MSISEAAIMSGADGQRSLIRLAWRLVDTMLAAAAAIVAPLARLLSQLGHQVPMARSVLDRFGISILPHHFSQPMVLPHDLVRPLDEERELPGLDLNVQGQLGLVAQFRYADELRAIPLQKADAVSFGYRNGSYEAGDAEMLYNMVRHTKPRRFVEIGSGESTLMVRLAIARNRSEDSDYRCDHLCIDPYGRPWLEQQGIDVLRERVERVPLSTFDMLEAGDVLFIDSSHVIRPQGDVVFEYLQMLPRLKPGVVVHSHDIFTPRDYPQDWVVRERRLYDEQYLLEAFLAFNREFEVLLAVNWLARRHRDKLKEACPILCMDSGHEPGAFWFRRRPGIA